MQKANLNIVFYSLIDKNTYGPFSNTYFETFRINHINFSVENEIKTGIKFNQYEAELGKKIENFELIKQKKVIYNGRIELYLGQNIGYCCVDSKGINLNLLFQSKNNLNITINDKINFMTNRLQTNDRTNILLINLNLNWNDSIKINNKELINLDIINEKIERFSSKNTYQICFNNNNENEFCWKILESNELFNLEQFYNTNKDIVNKSYNELKSLIEDKDKINEENLKKIYNNNKHLKECIIQKYIWPKNVLETKFNNKEYIDFYFKILSILLIKRVKDKNNDIVVNDFLSSVEKLSKFKNALVDDGLKTFEKIFLLIDYYYSKNIIENNNYEPLKYITKSNIDSKSPLGLALKFLNDFVDELNEYSPFYPPLLSINSGTFYYTYKKKQNENKFKMLNIYGYNMISLNTLKKHLIDLIPNILLISEIDNKEQDYGDTSPYTGLITINILSLGKSIDISKDQKDDKINKHVGLIISKTLFHEAFGHEKSLYSKDNDILKFKSCISFFDNKGVLRFISEDNYEEEQFKKIEEVENEIFTKNDLNGDSGFYLEYYFGIRNGNYVIYMLEDIEDKTNLSVLLDPKLWNKNIELFQDYVELKHKLIYQYNKEILVSEDLPIEKQIEIMNNLISQEINKKNLLGKKRKGEISEEEIIDDKKVKKKNNRRKKKEKNNEFIIDYENIENDYYNPSTPPEIANILFEIMTKRHRPKH